MEFIIIGPGGDNLEITQVLNPPIQVGGLPTNDIIQAEADFGKMQFQNFKGDGFEIWLSNYHIDHAIQLIGRGDIPVLELHIQFKSGFHANWEGIGENLLREYQYGLTYSPFFSNKVSFQGGRHYQTFDIHFDLPFLQKLAPDFPVLDQFLLLIEKRKATTISHIPRFLTPEMIKIVKRILACPFKHRSAAFFLQCKVCELLLLILDQLSDIDPLAPIKLWPPDYDRLEEAKELIVKDFENPPTIKELARKVAMNDFKLKKAFKHVYGTTIFNYFQQKRMEKAQLLLMETNLSIKEISLMTGYEHVPNFNKAFLKHFNYTAAYLRRHKPSDHFDP